MTTIKRDRVLFVRVRPDDIERIDAAVASSGVSRSEWVRQVCLAAAAEAAAPPHDCGYGCRREHPVARPRPAAADGG